MQRVIKTEKYLSLLPSHHQELLSEYKVHLTDLRKCIVQNNEIIQLITKDVAYMFENVKHSDDQVIIQL